MVLLEVPRDKAIFIIQTKRYTTDHIDPVSTVLMVTELQQNIRNKNMFVRNLFQGGSKVPRKNFRRGEKK